MSTLEPADQSPSDDRPATGPAGQVPSEQHPLVIAASAWAGPLPQPEVLQGYESVIPGAANRILEMAERQSDHRMQMDKMVISGGSRRSYLGLVAGFALSAMVIVGGIYLIATDHDWAGASLVGLNLAGLAGVFVYGTKTNRDEQRQAIETSELDSQPS